MVEPVFQQLYSYIFDMDIAGLSSEETEMERPVPNVIFVVNFDKVCIIIHE